jgi:hypothetical protein
MVATDNGTAAAAPAAPAAAPAAPAPAAAPAAPAAMQSAAQLVPAAVMMTPEELNVALVAEMERIGKGREPIDAAMAKVGITGCAGQTAEQQQLLMAAVKAIPA